MLDEKGRRIATITEKVIEIADEMEDQFFNGENGALVGFPVLNWQGGAKKYWLIPESVGEVLMQGHLASHPLLGPLTLGSVPGHEENSKSSEQIDDELQNAVKTHSELASLTQKPAEG